MAEAIFGKALKTEGIPDDPGRPEQNNLCEIGTRTGNGDLRYPFLFPDSTGQRAPAPRKPAFKL